MVGVYRFTPAALAYLAYLVSPNGLVTVDIVKSLASLFCCLLVAWQEIGRRATGGLPSRPSRGAAALEVRKPKDV